MCVCLDFFLKKDLRDFVVLVSIETGWVTRKFIDEAPKLGPELRPLIDK
jgi:hypothetical protein